MNLNRFRIAARLVYATRVKVAIDDVICQEFEPSDVHDDPNPTCHKSAE